MFDIFPICYKTLMMIHKGSFFDTRIEVLTNDLINHRSLRTILISFDLLIDLL
jgi:hypothetical protein